MGNCECLNGCPFFHDKMKDYDGLRKICKEQYCFSTYTDCARYQVYKQLGNDYMPKDLYPNMYERAAKIISRTINADANPIVEAIPTGKVVDDIIKNLFAPVGPHK